MIAAHDREVIMAQGIYYDVDGRKGGPVTLIQLQLMASSGMLQPHHRVRREDSDQWLPARQVKGLFSPAEVAATAEPAIPPTEPIEEQDTEFSFGEPEAVGEAEYNSAFNFFAAPAAPRAPAQAPAPPPPPPPVPPAPAKKASKRVEQEEPVPVAAPAEPPPPPSAKPEPRPSQKVEEPKPEAQPALDPKTDVVGVVQPTVEVTGQAVELLADDTARPLDGKIVFRLTRNWLLASSRFGDGTTRSVYIRPQRIEAAILEQRPGPPRTKGGPYAVLAFRGSGVEVALSFHGSDKPYRAFLEKVLLLANSGRVK